MGGTITPQHHHKVTTYYNLQPRCTKTGNYFCTWTPVGSCARTHTFVTECHTKVRVTQKQNTTSKFFQLLYFSVASYAAFYTLKTADDESSSLATRGNMGVSVLVKDTTTCGLGEDLTHF